MGAAKGCGLGQVGVAKGCSFGQVGVAKGCGLEDFVGGELLLVVVEQPAVSDNVEGCGYGCQGLV